MMMMMMISITGTSVVVWPIEVIVNASDFPPEFCHSIFEAPAGNHQNGLNQNISLTTNIFE